ncbi:MAG: metal ABC transporter permease [Clostridia bacterium]|nr:metal ABC transporter permease [Clostridia bacterium]
MQSLDMLSLYLTFPFVQYALLTGVVIALASSLLGVTLVTRRMSFISDSLSHMAFLSATVAGVLKLAGASMLLTLPVTAICTLLMLHSDRRNGHSDARLAMISVSSLAIGYLVINLFSGSGNVAGDVCTTLFGSTSILTLKSQDVTLCCVLSAIVVLFFILCENHIFAMTFDETFCRATGVKAGLYNVLLAVVIATMISLSMELVGALLTSALIIFPALTAMRVFRSFRGVIICSVICSVLCAVLGILISILASTPVGSTIVAAQVTGYLLFSLIGRLRR